MRVKTITCPNCGHANNFLAEECTQCGINFSRYYEELEKAETLRRHIEEQEQAEALKNEEEDKKRREAESLQRQQEEQARLEQEEQARLAMEERERIEEEKRLEAERLQEAQERADMLKRQQEALEKATALERQKEEEAARERLAAEARKPEKDEKEHREAEAHHGPQEEQTDLETETRRGKEEEQIRLEEEKRPEEKTAPSAAAEPSNPADDTHTVEIEELDTADIEEHAGAFDFIEYPADAPPDAAPLHNPGALDAPPKDYQPAASLEERLRIYEGQMLGLTYGDPAEIQNVKLLAAGRDHLQVFYPISRHVVSFPYHVIISITENAEGLSAVGPDISPVFPMVVELPRPFFHVV